MERTIQETTSTYFNNILKKSVVPALRLQGFCRLQDEEDLGMPGNALRVGMLSEISIYQDGVKKQGLRPPLFYTLQNGVVICFRFRTRRYCRHI